MALHPDRALDALARLLPAPLAEALRPHARIIVRQPGHIIMGYGDRSSDLYLILEGRVQAELHSPGGREVILGDLGPGELLGEFAALDDQPRSATVEAVTACTLACFPATAFRAAVFSQPETAEWMARQLVGHIRLVTEKLFELNALAVSNRLHCELLRLSIDAGISGNEAVIAPVPTHAELAARIGTHREAVTRELQYLAREGIADQAGRKLVVSDVDRLAQFVRAAVGDADLIQRASPAPARGAAE